MKLTSKISIRYDELYFAGVWVISPVRRFPRRRISSRTPWSRVDPKPFSIYDAFEPPYDFERES